MLVSHILWQAASYKKGGVELKLRQKDMLLSPHPHPPRGMGQRYSLAELAAPPPTLQYAHYYYTAYLRLVYTT